MRYFTYIAEQSFKTSETGERLFYRGGAWSRPYIIPDQETEERLYWKQVWMLRLLLGSMLIGQPFVFILYPQVVNEPYWFLAYLFVVMAVFWVVGQVLFARDLKGLQRAPARLGFGAFYREMASRHSRQALLLGLLGSLAFVAGGVWMLSAKGNIAVGILCTAFFGMCAIAWGYAYLLKVQSSDSPTESAT